jgi:hypothetical protein
LSVDCCPTFLSPLSLSFILSHLYLNVFLFVFPTLCSPLNFFPTPYLPSMYLSMSLHQWKNVISAKTDCWFSYWHDVHSFAPCTGH